jgi:hypothetical protein
MKFLSSIWLPPLIVLIVIAEMYPHGRTHQWGTLFGSVAVIWLWLDIPMTVVYVIVRIFRRASRDDARQQRPYGAP